MNLGRLNSSSTYNLQPQASLLLSSDTEVDSGMYSARRCRVLLYPWGVEHGFHRPDFRSEAVDPVTLINRGQAVLKHLWVVLKPFALLKSSRPLTCRARSCLKSYSGYRVEWHGNENKARDWTTLKGGSERIFGKRQKTNKQTKNQLSLVLGPWSSQCVEICTCNFWSLHCCHDPSKCHTPSCFFVLFKLGIFSQCPVYPPLTPHAHAESFHPFSRAALPSYIT